jgi:hypothetical protein
MMLHHNKWVVAILVIIGLFLAPLFFPFWLVYTIICKGGGDLQIAPNRCKERRELTEHTKGK